nr:1-deoxy-D-xylulose-5-phosphate synthase [Oscillospiraceae bacterium]
HQGTFDVPMLTSIPGTAIYSPSCYEELKICLKTAIYEESGLTAVRYPRGNDSGMKFPKENCSAEYALTECNSDTLLISYGRVYQAVWDAHCICDKGGCPTSILKLTKIFPVQEELIEIALQYKTVLFFEESSGYGGISTIFGSLLAQYGFQGQFVRVSADCFLKQASVPVLLDKSDLSAQAVCRYIYAYGCQD